MSSIVASSIPKEDARSLKQSYQPLQLHRWDCSDIRRPKRLVIRNNHRHFDNLSEGLHQSQAKSCSSVKSSESDGQFIWDVFYFETTI